MLNKETFNKGIEKLITEYGDRGFTMTKAKSLQWYGFMKELNNKEFERKIDYCLLNCNHVPFMADILNPQKKEEVRANVSAYKEWEPRN